MKFKKQQLVFAREYRSLSQTELASKIPGLSQSNLSKFEKGVNDSLSVDVLDRIIAYLGFPKEFYEVDIHNRIEFAHFRKKARVSKKQKVELMSSLKIIGYLIDQFSDIVSFPEMSLSQVDLEGGYTPEKVAQFVRNQWALQDKPVSDIMSLLERSGIFVKEIDADDFFDGVSFVTDHGNFVIVVNRNFSNDRKRFTLAHELGHILMHNGMLIPEYRELDDGIEKEAHRFAAELLMPSRVLRHQLDGLKLSHLVSLKKHWLVSMASILYRAKELQCITMDKFKYYFVEYSRHGYRKQEPVNVFIDTPKLFNQAYELIYNELYHSKKDMAKAFCLPIDVLDRYCTETKLRLKLSIMNR